MQPSRLQYNCYGTQIVDGVHVGHKMKIFTRAAQKGRPGRTYTPHLSITWPYSPSHSPLSLAYMKFQMAAARQNPKEPIRRAWVRQFCTPAASFTSRAQRKPIQFILVLGSVPLRCAARTLGVLSIQPPPRKLRCVPCSGPLGFFSGAAA
jgi:hypothetical protein